MIFPVPIDNIDYLVIGHVTCDLVAGDCQLGGTAAYSALTARALGLRTGIVTSHSQDISLEALAGIQIYNLPSDETTTFTNIQTPTGRIQTLTANAVTLGFHHIPETWRNTPIVHLGPVAQEIDPAIIRWLQNPLVGITPQGWLREWDGSGRVYVADWPEAQVVVQRAGAIVISIEDVSHDEIRIEELASYCPVLAVTEADQGARVFWHGDVRRYRPPMMDEVDAVGSGDIFAAAFFARLYSTRDPWEAARFATQLAAYSVTRTGLASIPTAAEIEMCLVEVY
jgi:sugar/nucleoside kinase (ribokinase family)